MIDPGPLHGDSVWTGADMAGQDRWVMRFPAAVLAELDAAVHVARDLD